MITHRLHERLDRLARDIGRLRPDWNDPERFFERRDELRCALRRIARKIKHPN